MASYVGPIKMHGFGGAILSQILFHYFDYPKPNTFPQNAPKSRGETFGYSFSNNFALSALKQNIP